MKQKRYSAEQIVRILMEIRSGQAVAKTCKKYGVSEQTVYWWKAKYGDLEVSEIKNLKALQDENARLKKIVAQQVMDIDALKDLLTIKW